MTDQATHTLIIYELVPEETRVYLIPDNVITPEHSALINMTDGVLVNSDVSNAGTDFLNDALCKKEHVEHAQNAEYACLYGSYEVADGDREKARGVTLSRIIRTGWIL